jgi:predicted glycogen debranching enzyme
MCAQRTVSDRPFASGDSALTFARHELGETARAFAREWLVTNGLGGFACGTLAQANTRRYHGLLVASLRPPVQRVVMVAKLEVLARYGRETYELGCNEFADGTIAPRGFERLQSYADEGGAPLWTYACADALLQQRVWMAHGRNTTYVTFLLGEAADAMDLELRPLCTYRDYHAHTRGGRPFEAVAEGPGCRLTAFPGAHPYRVLTDQGDFTSEPEWYWNFHHRSEAERGLDAQEDLFRPGTFRVRLEPGQQVTFIATAEADYEIPAMAFEREQKRRRALVHAVRDATPGWVQRLTLAADQFIVRRCNAQGELQGTSVIAGYPWFSDWGRDTMIALPGLALATGRHADAAAILRTFASHVSEGMLPNRFPDSGEAAEYNTVDATLWLFHAISAYLDATGDGALLRDLYPTLREIVGWHQRGSRYGIHVDPSDGLLVAGEPGVQLTWMDAKVGDWVVTPRTGKAVEINALWHFALSRMVLWARALNDRRAATGYAAAADQAAASFAARFWYPEGGCLYDVVDGPEGLMHAGRQVDPSLRPNQIFAVSLGSELVSSERARAVVEVCARELLTPVGLRSLSPNDPRYASRYCGDARARDGAYHQGTVWSWLLGPFALAHHRVYGNAAHALALLEGLASHLDEACGGTVSEIMDGNPPHAPRGCFAQAWSVAETLRAYHHLSAQRARAITTRAVGA